jgi:FlaA1/EpsC-like NDP-sugar epimerase
MHTMNSLSVVLAGVFRKRLAHIWTIQILQPCLFVASGVAAFLLRFDFALPERMLPALRTAVCVWVIAKIVAFHWLRLDRGMWRYFATPDLVRLAAASAIASAAASAVLLAASLQTFPRSVLVIDFLISLLLTSGVRAATRLLLEVASHAQASEQRRVFIYGAGAAGALLLSETRSSASSHPAVCGFIDDDRNKRGMTVNGVLVRGGGEDLARLVRAHQAREVLIAIPSATGEQMTGIIRRCRQAGASFRTMPAIAEIVSRRAMASQIRDVAVEDLLGRGPVELDRRRIGEKLRGGAALVTGAAGSIGSELCRQIAGFRPAALVAFDSSETGLFHLEREIRERFPGVVFHAEIGNIQNRQRLRELFARRAPRVVYHAAAYKHVPMMESHAFEAVENNAVGAYNVASIAAEFAAEDFVMISSDKAVRPTNIMGATKRVSELIVRSLQNGGARYVAVRFGNVLGSNGSVVPIFKEQIAAGGPVTVTHPEMQRYFMTIPEAAQLVLQASTMGRGGEIFVLNMGQPVRIVELARQLILLSGLQPEEDIHIEFTGIRPGEKLYEELNLVDEQIVPTGHGKINVFVGACLPFDQAMRHLGSLRKACERRDLRALLGEIKAMVPDYAPSRELLAQLADSDLANLGAAVESVQPLFSLSAKLPAPAGA